MYERLLKEASDQGVDIYEMPMKPTIKGLYSDNNIGLTSTFQLLLKKLAS